MLLWLLQNPVLAALLAVGVAVLCRFARPNPAVRHVLWLLVLARLLMPPGLHWPWALPVSVARHDAPIAMVTAPETTATHLLAVEMLEGELVSAPASSESNTETIVETAVVPAVPV